MWIYGVKRISAANYNFASEQNKSFCHIIYTAQPFFFFMSEPFFKESLRCQLVFCSLILDRDTSTPHAIFLPCLFLLSISLLFLVTRTTYHYCFTTLGNTLKSKTLSFVQYILFLTISMSLTYLVTFCAWSWKVEHRRVTT